jgi:uncharacterized protein (UPF0332 family)
MNERPPLARGRQEVRAARALLTAGYPSQAVSHAFMAAFQAATAALQAVGETPATRAGVISAFGRRVVREGGLDYETGRILRKLFEDRNDVDHALAHAPPEEARAAIANAERLLEVTSRWIQHSTGRRTVLETSSRWMGQRSHPRAPARADRG